MDNKDSKLLDNLINAPASGRILSKDMDKYVENCISGDSPPCRSVCPLNLDVVAFNNKMQKGNFNSAYTIYRDQVLFPEIVCNLCEQYCANSCVRKDVDDAIRMKKLERAAIDYTRSTTPVKYNIPKKDKRIAVIGAGLCGLSCTIKLSSHGYDVTVFEKNDKVGGSLWGLLSPEIFITEIENQMQHLNYELKLNTEITDLDELKEFDAIFIATGKGGSDFGLLEGLNRDSLGGNRDGIFIAGGLIGSTPLEAIENGIRASQSIESYLKTNRMHEMIGITLKKPSRFKMNASRIRPAKAVESDRYTKEQAIQEARRCLKCDCRECQIACDMMQFYNKMPKKIVSDVRMSFNPVEGLQPRVATRMLSSCMDCGACNNVCPTNIDMGDFLINARRIMHREGSLPLAFHDYWIRDMYHAQNDKSYIAKNAPGSEKSQYMFFPGCQLGASDPNYVKEAYSYLLDKMPETGLILGCCGAPAEWACDEALMTEMADNIRKQWQEMDQPQGIFACPTCQKMFRRYLPEIPQVSLYDIIKEKGLPDKQKGQMGTVSVFDPCASRYDSSMQKSVRDLVIAAGLTIDELPCTDENTQCCGYGGHIYVPNPALYDRIVTDRVSLSDHPYIAYCANCRDVFALKDKPVRHILDLVFGLNNERRLPPSLSARRSNRIALKADLLQNIWGEEIEKMPKQTFKIIIPPEVEEKLNLNLITKDDIRQVIEHCEETGNKVIDTKTGNYIGHLKEGVLTFWVIYQVEGDVYTIVNAYYHRMTIEGER
ncbi:MAG: pyridine nucleotide-disulfide oxidoreductase/dicluster-binding protein [Bacillota bacterium]|jgi:Fe-S oxidoreductase